LKKFVANPFETKYSVPNTNHILWTGLIDMNQTREFSTFDVLKILDIKRERLREWVNQGFIKPTVSAEGQGTKAVFKILDIYKIAVFKKLVEAGINRKKAADLINTNPIINSLEEVRNMNFILVLDEENGGAWTSYFEPNLPAFKKEKDISEDSNWNIGILINFKKLRAEIQSSI
jgi:hypothetical protein